MQGWADDVDFANKTLKIEESVVDDGQSRAMVGDRYAKHSEAEEKEEKSAKHSHGKMWDINYDKLVVSVGCYSQTFGTKGVKEHAFFVKDVGDTRRIRRRILDCFEIAALPTTSLKVKKMLLHFAIVGGGPTGMEFSAELADLVNDDMAKIYPELKEHVKLSVYDVAPNVLSMFDKSLGEYAMQTFRREGIAIKTEHHVEELREGMPTGYDSETGDLSDSQTCYTLKTKEEGEVGVGLCVWSTGNMMNPFVAKALQKVRQFPHSSAEILSDHEKSTGDLEAEQWLIKKDGKTGALVVDDHLRVQLHTPIPESKDGEEQEPKLKAVMNDVFALGDNAMLETATLPATAQTANQQALWLGKRLNKGDLETETFTFKNMGVMTYLGDSKGLVQTEGHSGISGRSAWLVWRGAYLTMSVSWKNKILIPIYWYV